jgi:CRP-like cAMP-binding protein
MSAETAAPDIIEVLERAPMLRGLPRSDLENIAALVRARDLNAGEFLFREGDAGDRFYVVADGAVEVLKERPLGDHEVLAVKRGGQALGELSLLSEAPRSVSVRALEHTRLYVVSRDEFSELLGGESLAVRLMRGLARALRARQNRYAPRETATDDTFRQFGRMVLGGLEPKQAPRVEGFRIAGATAREEGSGGGALWDGYTTEDGRAILALLDVKGTALPPAYLIAVTRALLREVGPEEPFESLLARLNAAIFENLFEGLDACVEAALIEASPDGVRWSCAGEQAAFIMRGDGSMEEAPSHGPPLGILPEFGYDVATLDLAPGDSLLAFSDAPEGLVKGAMELARGRAAAEPQELSRMLHSAIGRVQARGTETDVAFILLKKT